MSRGGVAASLALALCGACSTSSGTTKVQPPADVHRAASEMCAATPPGVEPMGPLGVGQCTKNEDCKSGTNGHCVYTLPTGTTVCRYDQCSTDGDCAANEACACSSDHLGVTNVCVAGDCRTDADCASGYCSPSVDPCIAFHGYHCHTSADECVNNADCRRDSSSMFDTCVYDDAATHWKCMKYACPK